MRCHCARCLPFGCGRRRGCVTCDGAASAIVVAVAVEVVLEMVGKAASGGGGWCPAAPTESTTMEDAQARHPPKYQKSGFAITKTHFGNVIGKNCYPLKPLGFYSLQISGNETKKGVIDPKCNKNQQFCNIPPRRKAFLVTKPKKLLSRRFTQVNTAILLKPVFLSWSRDQKTFW